MEALQFGYNEIEWNQDALVVDGVTVPVFHARPCGMPLAGIVVATDIGGLRPLFTDMAQRLASHGFAVMVVEPFARNERARSLGASERLPEVAHLVDATQLGDLSAAADALVIRDDVARVGVLGFCMGGMYALKAAATDRFDCAVMCYGMLRVPEMWQSPEQRDALATAHGTVPTLAIFGGVDPWTPEADIAALRAVWDGRSDCVVTVVPEADHGFIHDPERPAHRPEDARAAWHAIMEFITPSK
jgi:carboxymethylenebutenolidase